MAAYTQLASYMPGSGADGSNKAIWRNAEAYLTSVWLDDYRFAKADVNEVRSGNFSYLFDIEAERLIAAWGISAGRHSGERDKARIAGHPQSAGPLYHRGHAIPHTLGGSLDINLVPQLGKVNIGAFRRLESEAVAIPGALYFTYWRYRPGLTEEGFPSQVPVGVDQGLLVPGRSPTIVTHAN